MKRNTLRMSVRQRLHWQVGDLIMRFCIWASLIDGIPVLFNWLAAVLAVIPATYMVRRRPGGCCCS